MIWSKTRICHNKGCKIAHIIICCNHTFAIKNLDFVCATAIIRLFMAAASMRSAARTMALAIMLRMNILTRCAAKYRIDKHASCRTARMHIKAYDTQAVPYSNKCRHIFDNQILHIAGKDTKLWEKCKIRTFPISIFNRTGRQEYCGKSRLNVSLYD